MSTRELHWRIGERDVTCRIEESRGQGTFACDGTRLSFRVLDATHVEVGGERLRFHVIHKRDSSIVWLNGRTYQLERARKPGVPGTAARAATGDVQAPMPGKLLRLEVALGDAVSERQTVAIMESMKMESALVAPRAGRVAEIRFQPGDALDMGEVVVVIDSAQ
jgi:pyruvate carboxylase subunit B